MTQNINLYDASLRAKRDWLTAPNAAAAVGACLLAVVLGTGWSRHELSQLQGPAAETQANLEAAQTELTDLTQRATEIRPDARLQAQVQLAQASVTQRQAALELLRAGGLGNETGHAAALAAFARQSINGLWLTGMALDNHQVALRGRTLNPELIPAYVARLNKEEALQGRSFRALEIERPMVLPVASAASASATAALPRSAPYVEFSLASAQGAEAPAKTTPETRP